MKKLVALALIIAATTCTVVAQNRFDASLFAGLNVCQVDGDGAGHYNHPGLRAGVGTSFALGGDRFYSPWRLVVELAYTQKGAHIDQYDGDIALQYVEIPLMLAYDTKGSRLRLSAGVAPAVLVGAKVTFGGTVDQNHSANYNRMDWLPLTAAIRYRFTDHLCIEGRYQNSMLSVTRENGSGTYRIFRSNIGSFNRLLSIGLAWQF